MYNPQSLRATEFIDHEEVLASLAYADTHSADAASIDRILAKAEQRKGLNHREASVLLSCNMPDKIQAMYALAEQIKKDFYGNRIVLFAPLYLSNYCINSCVYCPYHRQNSHMPRKKLSQADIVREVTALQDMGHKRLAIEAGEDPVINPIEYILESIETIYGIRHRNGAIRRVNVNIAATTVENYRKLKDAQIGTYILFHTTSRVMKNCIRPAPSTTMRGTLKLWTVPWKGALTMWAWVCSSAWNHTVMSLPPCSCTPNTLKLCMA